ncbi:elongation factor G [Methylobacterium planeticum]|uniref:Elongation factor G n=1 Tax=Methylobacterium planeticum TaxID=2615211 RepID=A0A6N6MR79_9HYPH|nr:elongation factor G [Methylobacterium planeticum]KAB1072762.1 elongation factor G [Methylobacterium planeticum]
MASQPRCIALVGPAQSGKSVLLDALVERAGGPAHSGREGAEARGGTEPVVAALTYLGEAFTVVDCPGAVEFAHAMNPVLAVCDAAVVVCEADERKLPALELVMRALEAQGVPRLLFVNKIDTATQGLRETLSLLQGASQVPLLLRQIPIVEDGAATGYIDLALERAFVYRPHAPSTLIALPEGVLPQEKEERFTLLERLADHDDALMEALITEAEPPPDRIFADLARELREGLAVSVLIGSGLRGNGIGRLLKALRHEAPGLAETRARLGIAEAGPPLARVLATRHAGFSGKLSVARVLRGTFQEGEAVAGPDGAATRIAGLVALDRGQTARIPATPEGAVAGFARLDGIGTGQGFAAGGHGFAAGGAAPGAIGPAPPSPVYASAIRVRDRKDDVRLTGALAKVTEEDPGLVVEHDADLEEIRLLGQGEMHLRTAIERLSARFGVGVEASRPKVGYRETIRGAAAGRGRHKKQTGGHGQFADVQIAVRPLARGEGFRFADAVVGGAVPRNYIPSVEAGARAYLRRGPLGFPLVDLEVTLTDGSAHAVDSSDAAFQIAARLALDDALPKAGPVLLEPVLAVEIATPSGATARATGLVTGRRGQILGYDARPGWPGWDLVQALIPAAETADLIVELRSVSAGVGSFTARFDHMAELSGRPAELVLASDLARRAG